MKTNDAKFLEKFEEGRKLFEELRTEKCPHIPENIFFPLGFLLSGMFDRLDYNPSQGNDTQILQEQILGLLNEWYGKNQQYLPQIQASLKKHASVLRRYIELTGFGPLEDNIIFIPED